MEGFKESNETFFKMSYIRRLHSKGFKDFIQFQSYDKLLY